MRHEFIGDGLGVALTMFERLSHVGLDDLAPLTLRNDGVEP